MIADNSGKINIENYGFTISPGFTSDDLLSNKEKDAFHLDGANEDYERYSIKQCVIAGRPFWIAIFFFKRRVTEIFLQLLDTKSEMLEWSEEGEMIRKEGHDNMLVSQYGTTDKEFSWGRIFSVYDGKAGESIIRIRYEK